MTQSNIPAPTPADDIVPHQERIEYLIGQMTARDKLEELLYDHAHTWEVIPGSEDVPETLTSAGAPPGLDENAGGVIDGIAYMVSGYAMDSTLINQLYNPEFWEGVRFLEPVPNAVYEIPNGQRVCYYNYKWPADMVLHAQGAVTLTYDSTGNTWTTTGGSLVSEGSGDIEPWVWPFIERWDIANERWLTRIPLPHLSGNSGPVYAAEGGFAGVIDGKLYFGGGDGDDVTGQELFVFDPANESFVRKADLPVMADYNPYGVVNGKLWLAYEDGTALVYDPQTNAWTSKTLTGSLTGGMDQMEAVVDGATMYWAVHKTVYSLNTETLVAHKSPQGVWGSPTGWFSLGISVVRPGRIRVYDWHEGTFDYEVSTETWIPQPPDDGEGGIISEAFYFEDAQGRLTVLSGVNTQSMRGVMRRILGRLDKPTSGLVSVRERKADISKVSTFQAFRINFGLMKFSVDANQIDDISSGLEMDQAYADFPVDTRVIGARGLPPFYFQPSYDFKTFYARADFIAEDASHNIVTRSFEVNRPDGVASGQSYAPVITGQYMGGDLSVTLPAMLWGCSVRAAFRK